MKGSWYLEEVNMGNTGHSLVDVNEKRRFHEREMGVGCENVRRKVWLFD